MRTITIQAWPLHKKNNNHFLSYTHWIYLCEIVKYYDEVTIIGPTIENQNLDIADFRSISDNIKVNVVELPSSDTYRGAIRHFFRYVAIYKRLKNTTHTYSRYPSPFGWLQKVYFPDACRVVHFVGDPLDAARSNPNFSVTKKNLMKFLFFPEHLMYMWACRGAKVYTNGPHLSNKIDRYNIQSETLISSTLVDKDFYYQRDKSLRLSEPKLIYLGYLRTAKGVETIIRATKLLQQTIPRASLTIVGSGDFENELKRLVSTEKLSNVQFLGRIGDRNLINNLLRDHDIFCFGSLSEGSPRVILEAMANGLNVVSTPVGSLPYTFEDSREILFANFNDEYSFKDKIIELLKDPEKSERLRQNAYQKVRQFTIESFIKKIFHDNKN